MTKRALLIVALVLTMCFMVSAVATVSYAQPPLKCNKCIKEGCPSGHCYTDCWGCCYFDWRYGTVCYR